MTEKGPTVAIPKGGKVAQQGPVAVRIDEAEVKGGAVKLTGAFRWAKGGEATGLTSR
jgi:hypothetical protein